MGEQPQKKKKRRSTKEVLLIVGLTLLAAFVIVISLPIYGGMTGKALQAKALSNARQVGTACKSYAGDQGGLFPSEIDPKTGAVIVDENGNPLPPANSNLALKSLIPDYVPTEELFCVENSRFTPLPPDEKFETVEDTLQKGENHWGYMFGNIDSDTEKRLLLFDGASDPKTGQWSKDSRGNGTHAIIIFTDISASNAKLDENGRLAPPNDIYFDRGTEGKWADHLTPLNPK